MKDLHASRSPRGDILRAARRGVSPLRYPGGKRKLAPALADLIDRSGIDVDLLVEPFAGGAAVSISLLDAGYVRSIALADLDPLVASFWRVVFSPEAHDLAELIRGADVTIDEWRRQKWLEPRTRLETAFKCFFLNRTSFSGTLTNRTGPMGGHKQVGEYRIDYRFSPGYRDKLARRIVELSGFSDRVLFVENESYADTVRRVREMRSPGTVLWYLDPPYFDKADVLYRHVFKADGHAALRAAVDGLPGHWILSYDDHPEARRLYGDHPGFSTVNLRYSARANLVERPFASEVLVSDLIARERLLAFPDFDEPGPSNPSILKRA